MVVNANAVGLDDILTALPHLSKLEREAVAAQLAHKDAKATRASDFTSDERMMWDVLCEAGDFGDIALSRYIPSRYNRARYAKLCNGMFSYMTGACGRELTRTEARAFMLYCFRLSVRHIEVKAVRSLTAHSEGRVTPKELLDRMNWIPSYVDKAFPGYAKSGMLIHILRSIAEQGKVAA